MARITRNVKWFFFTMYLLPRGVGRIYVRVALSITDILTRVDKIFEIKRRNFRFPI